MKAHTAVRTAMTKAAEKMRVSLALDAVSYPEEAYPVGRPAYGQQDCIGEKS